MSLAALCTLGTIYITAIHSSPERKSAVLAPPPGCMPSHCRAKISSTP
ncbi:hypothetical protein [Bradyrhizobium sp. S69]|nr:hypothetical protein [Bradyrhizobium sp. S69]